MSKTNKFAEDSPLYWLDLYMNHYKECTDGIADCPFCIEVYTTAAMLKKSFNSLDPEDQEKLPSKA